VTAIAKMIRASRVLHEKLSRIISFDVFIAIDRCLVRSIEISLSACTFSLARPLTC
jgi:hypothetical protein